jgi:RNA polymerase sigma-70 factor (ECF subfamily)
MAFQKALTADAFDEEGALVYRAQQADVAAWDEIFERNYDHIYSFVFCRTGDRTAAEDIAAEVFLEAWKGIRRFNYRGKPLLAWLYRIAHNQVADYLRKRTRARAQPLPDDSRLVGAGEDEAERIALWQSVATAMKRLTLEQQQVLVTRFIQGMSLNETGALLGKSENAVKALEFRALRSVRRNLEGCGER